MLHVILGILKVIGIILLVIIGLLVICLLGLLFVPVRYRISGRKEGQALECHVLVSWLLHAIGLAADYRENHLVIKLKLFGIPWKNTDREGEKTQKRSREAAFSDESDKKKEFCGGSSGSPEAGTEEKTSPGENKAEADTTERTLLVEDEPETDTTERTLLMEDEPETDTTERTLLMEDDPGTDRSEKETPVESGPGTDTAEKAPPEEDESETDGEEDTSPYKKKAETVRAMMGRIKTQVRRIAGMFLRLWHVLVNIFEFILYLPERLLDWVEKISAILDGGEDAVEKLQKTRVDLQKKAEPFLTDNSKALYKRLLGYLNYLWKCYGPRKIRGWLRFGTGEPDITGELTGLLYLLLPPSADRFELLPDFSETVFETDIMIKGRIRACHLVKIAFLMWRDKQLRRLIRKVRAKGGQ